MLTDRMQETLNRLLALLTQEARRNFIPVSKIEIRGFVDPEEDTKEVVVTQWVKVPPSTALDYWDRLGAAVELWIDYLPETLASIVLERIAIKVGGMLMPDPLDPLASFHLAQELAERSDEVRLRTAIGRAYYALFLIAREKTGVRDRGRVHKNVIEAIKKRKGYLTTGEQLDSLRRLRTVADYELLPHNPDDGDWARNWSTAQALAERILPKLQVW